MPHRKVNCSIGRFYRYFKNCSLNAIKANTTSITHSDVHVQTSPLNVTLWNTSELSFRSEIVTCYSSWLCCIVPILYKYIYIYIVCAQIKKQNKKKPGQLRKICCFLCGNCQKKINMGEKGKNLTELIAALNETKECIGVMNDVKVRLTKNKIAEAELPR